MWKAKRLGIIKIISSGCLCLGLGISFHVCGDNCCKVLCFMKQFQCLFLGWWNGMDGEMESEKKKLNLIFVASFASPFWLGFTFFFHYFFFSLFFIHHVTRERKNGWWKTKKKRSFQPDPIVRFYAQLFRRHLLLARKNLWKIPHRLTSQLNLLNSFTLFTRIQRLHTQHTS